MSQTKDYFKGLGEQFANDEYEFLKLIPSYNNYNRNEISMIYKALHKAIELHNGQYRKSGEPYIKHPIGAASILVNYGLDYEVICAALLHDTIEDTNYTLEECAKDFGNTIATLVDGATKIGKDVNRLTKQKILNSIRVDARSIAVKSADRLHNMYTLEHLKESKQKEIATETKDFYVPIAKTLGIYKLKDEFQDLSLFYLDKEEFLRYYEIKQILKPIYGKKLRDLADQVQRELSKNGIAMEYEHRIKNVGGIYEDINRGTELKKISDLFAIKMVLSDDDLCYESFDTVCKLCKLKDDSYEDFILNPKSNGYRSINFNVTYKDLDAQIRIRTSKMQAKNNLGVFSDWNEETQHKINDELNDELDRLAKRIIK